MLSGCASVLGYDSGNACPKNLLCDNDNVCCNEGDTCSNNKCMPESKDAGQTSIYGDELCCATVSYPDAGIWTNAIYQCGNIGQRFTMIPFLCFGDDGGALACNDPSCFIHAHCQGFEGTGVVGLCSSFAGDQ